MTAVKRIAFRRAGPPVLVVKGEPLRQSNICSVFSSVIVEAIQDTRHFTLTHPLRPESRGEAPVGKIKWTWFTGARFLQHNHELSESTNAMAFALTDSTPASSPYSFSKASHFLKTDLPFSVTSWATLANSYWSKQ